MKKKSTAWIVLGVALIGLTLCGMCSLCGLLAALSPSSRTSIPLAGGGAVAVIEIQGAIVTGQADSATSGSAVSGVVIEDLRTAMDDPSVGAIVLDMDTPGGSVLASVEIYEAFLESTKPVVTSMGETAASGGYYVACGTHRIVAHPDTLTGSIGVIWQVTNAAELMDKLGIGVDVIKSGPFKDQGSLFRPLTDQERDALQAIVDGAYDEFVRVVAEGRGMDAAAVRELADGRVFSGRQALELGLVDDLGNLEDAIQIAADMAGIEGEPEIIRYEHVPSWTDILLGYADRAGRPTELLLLEELLGANATPQPQYLYTGR
ncbi:MAG: signal peptide peptidase SppA [Anaerolineae bacterium]